MKLAKDALDVGLLTDDSSIVGFFEHAIGLGPPELLQVAPGVEQHRFDVLGSVLKVNVVGRLATDSRSGYASVLIADEGLGAPRTIDGPDGIRIEITRPGDRGIDRLGVRLRIPEIEAAAAYFRDALGWDVEQTTVRVGTTVLLLDETSEAPSRVELPVRGWTYLTVQVFDCDGETERVVSQGAALAAEARNLRDVARYSMVADPWGNQLEISQRSSVTGVPIRSAE